MSDAGELSRELSAMERRYRLAHADGENARRELHAFKGARGAAERALPRKVQQLDALHKAASDALTWWENHGLFDPDHTAFTETLDVLRDALVAASPVPEEGQ